MARILGQKTKAIAMHPASNYILLSFIVAAVIAYAYFAQVAVRTITVLEKTKTEMQSLSVEVSELESKFLAIENNMNMVKAKSLGFVEVENPIFIIRGNSKSLSLKTD